MFSTIKIASRKTPLAKIQAYLVAQAIKKVKQEKPIEFHFKETHGDKDLESPLWKMGQRGVFTRDFNEDLILNKVDMVVHSWKDIDLEENPETEIISVLGRADQRDILLFKKSSLHTNKEQLTFLTSSPRRSYNLNFYFHTCLPLSLQNKKFIFDPVRGSITTRINKWQNSDADGIILAKAAIDRILQTDYPQHNEEELVIERNALRKILDDSLFQCIPLSINPNAPAQGGLAVEIKRDRVDIKRLLSKISIRPVKEAITKERNELAKHGGGCHQKIGVTIMKRHYGEIYFKRGLSDSGENLNSRELYREHLPKIDSNAYWPKKGEGLKFKRTESENFPKPPEGNLFIARITGWQSHWKQAEMTGIIWASGAKTMSELAKLDIWVSGCQDGLGEREPMLLEKILPNNHFKKVTHEESEAIDSEMDRVYTYKLELMGDIPDIRGKENFYWMSGSQFDLVTEKFPEILEKNHSCGPGLTFNHILSKTNKPPDVFLTYEDWSHYHNL
ncbi:MAG: uroporphyrinogen synthase [Leptospiraceae bacterium]|nr:uroporphyrinogen synthase [Leptospiraceae bacterium]